MSQRENSVMYSTQTFQSKLDKISEPSEQVSDATNHKQQFSGGPQHNNDRHIGMHLPDKKRKYVADIYNKKPSSLSRDHFTQKSRSSASESSKKSCHAPQDKNISSTANSSMSLSYEEHNNSSIIKNSRIFFPGQVTNGCHKSKSCSADQLRGHILDTSKFINSSINSISHTKGQRHETNNFRNLTRRRYPEYEHHSNVDMPLKNEKNFHLQCSVSKESLVVKKRTTVRDDNADVFPLLVNGNIHHHEDTGKNFISKSIPNNEEMSKAVLKEVKRKKSVKLSSVDEFISPRKKVITTALLVNTRIKKKRPSGHVKNPFRKDDEKNCGHQLTNKMQTQRKVDLHSPVFISPSDATNLVYNSYIEKVKNSISTQMEYASQYFASSQNKQKNIAGIANWTGIFEKTGFVDRESSKIAHSDFTEYNSTIPSGQRENENDMKLTYNQVNCVDEKNSVNQKFSKKCPKTMDPFKDKEKKIHKKMAWIENGTNSHYSDKQEKSQKPALSLLDVLPDERNSKPLSSFLDLSAANFLSSSFGIESAGQLLEAEQSIIGEQLFLEWSDNILKWQVPEWGLSQEFCRGVVYSWLLHARSILCSTDLSLLSKKSARSELLQYHEQDQSKSLPMIPLCSKGIDSALLPLANENSSLPLDSSDIIEQSPCHDQAQSKALSMIPPCSKYINGALLPFDNDDSLSPLDSCDNIEQPQCHEQDQSKELPIVPPCSKDTKDAFLPSANEDSLLPLDSSDKIEQDSKYCWVRIPPGVRPGQRVSIIWPNGNSFFVTVSDSILKGNNRMLVVHPNMDHNSIPKGTKHLPSAHSSAYSPPIKDKEKRQVRESLQLQISVNDNKLSRPDDDQPTMGNICSILSDKDGLPCRNITVISDDGVYLYDFIISVAASNIPNSGSGAFLTFKGSRQLKKSKRRKTINNERTNNHPLHHAINSPLEAAYFGNKGGATVKIVCKGLTNNDIHFWDENGAKANSKLPRTIHPVNKQVTMMEIDGVGLQDEIIFREKELPSGKRKTSTKTRRKSSHDPPIRKTLIGNNPLIRCEETENTNRVRTQCDENTHGDKIGFGKYKGLVESDYFPATGRTGRVTFSSHHKGCGYIDIGRYAPFLLNDRKPDLIFSLKSFFFSSEPAAWGFDVREKLGEHPQMVDLTDETTGKPHSVARSNLTMYVNEVGHNSKLIQNVVSNMCSDRVVKYLLFQSLPLKKGQTVELLGDYTDTYEEIRERKGYGKRNINGEVKCDMDDAARLDRDLKERRSLENHISSFHESDIKTVLPFITEKVLKPIEKTLLCDTARMKKKMTFHDNDELEKICVQWVARRRIHWVSSRLKKQLEQVKFGSGSRGDSILHILDRSCKNVKDPFLVGNMVYVNDWAHPNMKKRPFTGLGLIEEVSKSEYGSKICCIALDQGKYLQEVPIGVLTEPAVEDFVDVPDRWLRKYISESMYHQRYLLMQMLAKMEWSASLDKAIPKPVISGLYDGCNAPAQMKLFEMIKQELSEEILFSLSSKKMLLNPFNGTFWCPLATTLLRRVLHHLTLYITSEEKSAPSYQKVLADNLLQCALDASIDLRKLCQAGEAQSKEGVINSRPLDMKNLSFIGDSQSKCKTVIVAKHSSTLLSSWREHFYLGLELFDNDSCKVHRYWYLLYQIIGIVHPLASYIEWIGNNEVYSLDKLCSILCVGILDAEAVLSF